VSGKAKGFAIQVPVTCVTLKSLKLYKVTLCGNIHTIQNLCVLNLC